VVQVTEYGPEFMVYSGPKEEFNEACRTVLHALSTKVKTGENQISFPDYGEGASSSTEGTKQLALKTYLKTKDDDGAEYKITTIVLGNRYPVVMLESTSADERKLVNMLNAEFAKRGIRVDQYK